MKQLQAALKQTSIGKELSEDQLDRLLQAGTVLEVKENYLLLQEGELSDSLFVILEGEAQVTKVEVTQAKAGGETKKYQIAMCGQGSVLGEIGLLLNEPQISTVRTLKPTKVFSCSSEAFAQLLSNEDSISSKLGIQLARIIGSRLQNITNEFVYLLQERDRWQQKISTLEQDTNRTGLLKQVEQLKSENLSLQKQLQKLNANQQKNSIARKGWQFTFAIAGILFTLFVLGTFFARSNIFASIFNSEDKTRENPLIVEESAPVLIPFVKNKKQCEARKSTTVWIKDKKECYDLEYNRNF